MKIKDFYTVIVVFSAIFIVFSVSCAQPGNMDNNFIQTKIQTKNDSIFESVIYKAKAGNWKNLPFGDCMIRIGNSFIGTPYIGGTLETSDKENTIIDLTGLDCVTFVENTLGIARIINKNKTSFSDLKKEITYTRYRNGIVTDYSSRLHYTADWIYDNVSKGVIEDITKQIGGVLFPVHVNFMSENPKYYNQLANSKAMVEKIKAIEEEINKREYYFIPKNKVKDIEIFLQNGDIIAIATNKKGLDYSHVGMISVDKDKIPHFLHASSKQKKVVIGLRLSDYLNSVSSDTGITVLRPVLVFEKE